MCTPLVHVQLIAKGQLKNFWRSLIENMFNRGTLLAAADPPFSPF